MRPLTPACPYTPPLKSTQKRLEPQILEWYLRGPTPGPLRCFETNREFFGCGTNPSSRFITFLKNFDFSLFVITLVTFRHVSTVFSSYLVRNLVLSSRGVDTVSCCYPCPVVSRTPEHWRHHGSVVDFSTSVWVRVPGLGLAVDVPGRRGRHFPPMVMGGRMSGLETLLVHSGVWSKVTLLPRNFVDVSGHSPTLQ